jgi:hypothetical protein
MNAQAFSRAVIHHDEHRHLADIGGDRRRGVGRPDFVRSLGEDPSVRVIMS